MSRVAKEPIPVPSGVDIKIASGRVTAKGPKGEISMDLNSAVSLRQEENLLRVELADEGSAAIAGTMRSLVNNLVTGVTNGFERKLKIIGVDKVCK